MQDLLEGGSLINMEEIKEIQERNKRVELDIKDIEASLMHPRVLIRYKKELVGDHHEFDIAFLERYCRENNL